MRWKERRYHQGWSAQPARGVGFTACCVRSRDVWELGDDALDNARLLAALPTTSSKAGLEDYEQARRKHPPDLTAGRQQSAGRPLTEHRVQVAGGQHRHEEKVGLLGVEGPVGACQEQLDEQRLRRVAVGGWEFGVGRLLSGNGCRRDRFGRRVERGAGFLGTPGARAGCDSRLASAGARRGRGRRHPPLT